MRSPTLQGLELDAADATAAAAADDDNKEEAAKEEGDTPGKKTERDPSLAVRYYEAAACGAGELPLAMRLEATVWMARAHEKGLVAAAATAAPGADDKAGADSSAGGAPDLARAVGMWEAASRMLAEGGGSQQDLGGGASVEPYEVKAEIARLYETGLGDTAKAAAAYAEASELAMAAFKSKLGMKYMMKAEELQG